MKRVVWSRAAQKDIDELIAFYGQFGPDLADRLIDRIEDSAAKLLDFPRLGPALPDSERRFWRAKRTPYVLVYRPIDLGVRILRVQHDHKDWRPPA